MNLKDIHARPNITLPLREILQVANNLITNDLLENNPFIILKDEFWVHDPFIKNLVDNKDFKKSTGWIGLDF